MVMDDCSPSERISEFAQNYLSCVCILYHQQRYLLVPEMVLRRRLA
jgi:hypothetical protein